MTTLKINAERLNDIANQVIKEFIFDVQIFGRIGKRVFDAIHAVRVEDMEIIVLADEVVEAAERVVGLFNDRAKPPQLAKASQQFRVAYETYKAALSKIAILGNEQRDTDGTPTS